MSDKKIRTKIIHPDWATVHKKPGTELRCIKGRYYLYEVSSKYDTEKKRARKITGRMLGSISPQKGFVPSHQRVVKQDNAPTIDFSRISTKEYGIACFIDKYLDDIVSKLKPHFPDTWTVILGMVYCRFVHHSCLKNMALHYASSYLSESYPQKMDEKEVSLFLRELGKDRPSSVEYMRSFIGKGDYVLADMTNIFSGSTKIPLSKKGYNSDMVFDGQFNLLYIYSATLSMPVFYRLNPGNIREVKAFKLCLKESSLDNALIIFDKGFFSEANLTMIEQHKLRFIVPLRRDNQQIDYSLIAGGKIKSADNYFQFEKRYIWYLASEAIGNKKLVIFQDDYLRQQEEKDYLARIDSKLEGYSLAGYHNKKEQFGTISLLTNETELTSEAIYLAYKSRMGIEVMFDGIKNILDNDKTYMQNEDALQGWMFLNHIALQWYYKIYSLIKEKGLTKRLSVNDVIIRLKEIRKVKIDKQWHLEPINSTVEKTLAKAGIHIT